MVIPFKDRHFFNGFLTAQKQWIKWLMYLFLALLLLLIVEKTREMYNPLIGLPPLEQRIGDIKNTVNVDDFTFAIVGDNKNNKGVFPQILASINDEANIAFVVHSGDVVRSPKVKYAQDFFKSLRVMHAEKPILVVAGNHDSNSHSGNLYERAFGPRHYTLALGENLLVMVDGNAIGSKAENDWLQNILKHNSVDKKIIVFIHQPLYDPRVDCDHCLPPQISRKLLDMFKQYHVAHIYSGHLHGYWRGNWESIPYTITAGGGATLYSSDPAHGFYHYIKVRIKNGHMIEEVVGIDGSLFARGKSKVNYYLHAEPLACATIFTGIIWLFALCFFNRRVNQQQ